MSLIFNARKLTPFLQFIQRKTKFIYFIMSKVYYLILVFLGFSSLIHNQMSQILASSNPHKQSVHLKRNRSADTLL